MNPFQYEITLSADLGAVLPPVGELCDNLNDHLAKWNVDEKLSVRSNCFKMHLASKHELTSNDIEKVKKVITDQFNASQPAWKVKVESFRRKPGNVQQSVIQ